MARSPTTTFDLSFRALGRLEYGAALEIQERLVEERRAGAIGDTVLFLEHEPVYTIGRTRDRSSLGDVASLPAPVVEINRGGKATYHGPGQLVGYPILDLAAYGRDLHRYLRVLEDALVAGCREAGVTAARREGLTGVWCGPSKIASIGVGVRHWISMHGFAINVAGDLTPFAAIDACGLGHVPVTSVTLESGVDWTVEGFANRLRPHLCEALRALLRG